MITELFRADNSQRFAIQRQHVSEVEGEMTIKWNVVDKTDYLREYEAKINNIEFYIWHSSDAGFGITAYRINPDGSKDSLQTRFGIIWMRTLKRCKAHAENILVRAIEHRRRPHR